MTISSKMRMIILEIQAANAWNTEELEVLVDEIGWMEVELEGSYGLTKRQGELLRAAANAIRGEPPPLTLWSHHDIAERIRAREGTITKVVRDMLLHAHPTEEECRHWNDGEVCPECGKIREWAAILVDRMP